MEAKAYFTLQSEGARGVKEAADDEYKIITDGNNTPVKVVNFENKNICRRNGTIVLEALKRSKLHNNLLIIRRYKDRKTGVIYGIPDGINPKTKQLEFRRIQIEDNEVLDLSIAEDAMKWVVIKNCPYVQGSPNLGSNKPIFKIVDQIKEAETYLSKRVIKRKAETIAEALTGDELLEQARNLGLPTKGISVPVLHMNVIKSAEQNPERFMEIWDSPNKLEISVLKRAIAVGLVIEDRMKGYLYNTIPLGFTEPAVVEYLREHPQVRQAIDMQSKKVDEDSKRAMSVEPETKKVVADEKDASYKLLMDRLAKLEEENKALRSVKADEIAETISANEEEADDELLELIAEGKRLGLKGAHMTKMKGKDVLRQKIADKKRELENQ